MKSTINQPNSVQAFAAIKSNSLTEKKVLQRKRVNRVAPTNLNYHLANMRMHSDAKTRVQPKLFVGAPNDHFEQEADRVADTVMRMPISSVQLPTLQREIQGKKDEKDKNRIQRKPSLNITPLSNSSLQPKPKKKEEEDNKNRVQRKMNNKKEKDEKEQNRIQRKPALNAATALDNQDDELDSKIASLRHTGQPLPKSERQFFEPRFNRDFSQVRVHTGEQAANTAQSINSRAFTLGNDIVFNRGQFQPGTDSGRHLMAHELTHVVQQNGGSNNASRNTQINVQRKPTVQRALLPSIVPNSIVNKINHFAEQHVPFYKLIKVILGKNPITDEKVLRTGLNFLKALLPDSLISQLEASKELKPAGAWLSKQISTLNISWQKIKGFFSAAWQKTSFSIFSPAKSVVNFVNNLISVSSGMLNRIKTFAVNVKDKVVEFVITGVLSKAGKFGTKLLSLFKKGKAVFAAIIKNPIQFIKNVLRAIAGGFRLFKKNFTANFKSILFNWLFGTLSAAGIQLPETFTFKSIFGLIAQVLGITYDNIRAKVVKKLGARGEQIVSVAEKSVAFMKKFVKEGPAALWEQVQTSLASLKDKLIGSVMEWLQKTIIVKAVTKLALMANPAGGIVTLVQGIYNVFSFLVERGAQLKDFFTGIISTLAKVASGEKSDGIAKFVEGLLVKASSLAVSLLARLIGLGGISKKIKTVIDKLRKPVDKAMDKAINWIVNKAKTVWSKGKAAAKKLFQWWKSRKEFTTKKGEKHSLFFEGKGKKARLFMASKKSQADDGIEERIEGYIASLKTLEKNNPEAAKAVKKARTAIKKKGFHKAYGQLARHFAMSELGNVKEADFAKLLSDLGNVTSVLMDVTESVPDTMENTAGSAKNEAKSKSSAFALDEIIEEGITKPANVDKQYTINVTKNWKRGGGISRVADFGAVKAMKELVKQGFIAPTKPLVGAHLFGLGLGGNNDAANIVPWPTEVENKWNQNFDDKIAQELGEVWAKVNEEDKLKGERKFLEGKQILDENREGEFKTGPSREIAKDDEGNEITKTGRDKENNVIKLGLIKGKHIRKNLDAVEGTTEAELIKALNNESSSAKDRKKLRKTLERNPGKTLFKRFIYRVIAVFTDNNKNDLDKKLQGDAKNKDKLNSIRNIMANTPAYVQGSLENKDTQTEQKFKVEFSALIKNEWRHHLHITDKGKEALGIQKIAAVKQIELIKENEVKIEKAAASLNKLTDKMSKK